MEVSLSGSEKALLEQAKVRTPKSTAGLSLSQDNVASIGEADLDTGKGTENENEGINKMRYVAKRGGITINRKEIPKLKSPPVSRSIDNRSAVMPGLNMNSSSQSLPGQIYDNRISQCVSLGSPFLPRYQMEHLNQLNHHFLSQQLNVLSAEDYVSGSYKQYFAGLQQQQQSVFNQGVMSSPSPSDSLEIRRQFNNYLSPFNCNSAVPTSDQSAIEAIEPSEMAGVKMLGTSPNYMASKGLFVLKSTDVVPTTTSTTTSTFSASKMPTTMITTTSINMTVMQTGSACQLSSSSFTNTTILHLNDNGSAGVSTSNVKEVDTKRKRYEETDVMTDNKRWNVNKQEGLSKSDELMQKVLSELADIKTKVTSIQEDNIEWKRRMNVMETDITDIKESVEMAHNLVYDERRDRQRYGQMVESRYQR